MTLVERSKMHYIDKPTFFNILRDAWNRCKASDGMDYEQLEKALSVKNVPHVAIAVEVERPSSIRFLDMSMSRKGYMKRILDLQRAIETMTWPSQNNRPGIAGASRGLFLGAQTNRGYQQGCVSKRTFDAKYVQVLKKVHSLAMLSKGDPVYGHISDEVGNRSRAQSTSRLPQSREVYQLHDQLWPLHRWALGDAS